ncbi:MAG TPA: GxxExxY protein [Candidatus Polarisedimenticolia bacterium]|jgi:GxxExxY protein|nr:GxxExxY protein [Candidatus Polarisedimenticolia bacterium]
MAIDSKYKHSELTDLIIAVFYEVYNELGFGFLESVYRKSLCLALLQKGVSVEQEVPVAVFFRGQNVGDFRADLVVNRTILLELKTAEQIIAAHASQVLNYLRSTALELGLILNFGPKPQVRRLLLDNSRKHAKSHHAGGSF